MTELSKDMQQARKDQVSTAAVEHTPSFLGELVQRFRVCWEVWPECLMVGREKRQVGFALELSGAHEHGVACEGPGCQHCQSVFNALLVLAVYILPRGRRPSTYKIEPYDQALHSSPAAPHRRAITLTVKILHRDGFDSPVDACEVRCLEDMKQRLRELGAPQAHWKSAGARTDLSSTTRTEEGI